MDQDRRTIAAPIRRGSQQHVMLQMYDTFKFKSRLLYAKHINTQLQESLLQHSHHARFMRETLTASFLITEGRDVEGGNCGVRPCYDPLCFSLKPREGANAPFLSGSIPVCAPTCNKSPSPTCNEDSFKAYGAGRSCEPRQGP